MEPSEYIKSIFELEVHIEWSAREVSVRLEECNKLMKKAQTQNVSHMTETAQAKTARDFLRAGRAKRTNWQTAN